MDLFDVAGQLKAVSGAGLRQSALTDTRPCSVTGCNNIITYRRGTRLPVRSTGRIATFCDVGWNDPLRAVPSIRATTRSGRLRALLSVVRRLLAWRLTHQIGESTGRGQGGGEGTSRSVLMHSRRPRSALPLRRVGSILTTCCPRGAAASRTRSCNSRPERARLLDRRPAKSGCACRSRPCPRRPASSPPRGVIVGVRDVELKTLTRAAVKAPTAGS